MSEFRSTTNFNIGRIIGNKFSEKEVKYSPLNGIAIFEGDIALGTVARLQLEPLGSAIRGDKYRWPGRKIPYRIDPALPGQERVTDAIKHWESNTEIRFARVDNGNLSQYPDRVLFTSQDGCWSSVGRQ